MNAKELKVVLDDYIEHGFGDCDVFVNPVPDLNTLRLNKLLRVEYVPPEDVIRQSHDARLRMLRIRWG
jgi:hypothetical protein